MESHEFPYYRGSIESNRNGKSHPPSYDSRMSAYDKPNPTYDGPNHTYDRFIPNSDRPMPPYNNPPTRQGSHLSGRGSRYEQPFQNRYPQEEDVRPQVRHHQKAKVAKAAKTKKDTSAVSPLFKYFLFAANVIFLVAGVGLMASMIYVLEESEDEKNNINCFLDFVFNPTCILLLAGCLIWVPAFFGCYGALRENTCVVKLYLAFIIVLMVIEAVVGAFVLAFALSPDSLDTIGVYPASFLEESVQNYGNRVHQKTGCGRDSDTYLDLIQDQFECCGFSDNDEGYEDWRLNQYYNCNSTTPESCSVPISCCKTDTIVTSACGRNILPANTTDYSKIHTRGCEKGMRQILNDNIYLVIGVLAAGLIGPIFFVRCAMSFNSQIKEQRRKW